MLNLSTFLTVAALGAGLAFLSAAPATALPL